MDRDVTKEIWTSETQLKDEKARKSVESAAPPPTVAARH